MHFRPNAPMFSRSFCDLFLPNIVVYWKLKKYVFNIRAGVKIYLLIQNCKPLRSIRIIASYNVCLKQGWVLGTSLFVLYLASEIINLLDQYTIFEERIKRNHVAKQ